MKLYDKECPICGAYFRTPTKIRKYCDNCIKGSDKKAKKANRELARSKREHHNILLRKFNCEYCGREHIVESRLIYKLKISASSKYSWDKKDHYYCCEEHLDQARHDNTKCSNCGTILKGSTYSYSPFREFNYCSKECEDKHKYKLAIANGYVHKCINCGKEFIRNSKIAYFCCRKCTDEARKSGWKSEESKNQQNEAITHKFQVKKRCINCKSWFIKIYDNLEKAQSDNSKIQFCCGECKKEYMNGTQ